VLFRKINRPDVKYRDQTGAVISDSSLFTATSGTCYYEQGQSFNDTFGGIDYLQEGKQTYDDCIKDVKFNGKDVDQYIRHADGYDINYFTRHGEIIGLNFTNSHHVILLDWGTLASMSKFAFDQKEVYKCPDSEVFKDGDQDFAFCAAGTVKAALALVLGAVATALLALF